MKKRYYILAALGFFLYLYVMVAYAADYTNQNNVGHVCDLFAKDTVQASNAYKHGANLPHLLESFNVADVSEGQKDMASQAIAFVWKHQIDDPILAYILAMSACLKQKSVMAPSDDLMFNLRTGGVL